MRSSAGTQFCSTFDRGGPIVSTLLSSFIRYESIEYVAPFSAMLLLGQERSRRAVDAVWTAKIIERQGPLHTLLVRYNSHM